MELRPSGRFRQKRDGNKIQFIMKDVRPEDAGEITCEVSNRKGKDTATCKLAVNGMSLLYNSEMSEM